MEYLIGGLIIIGAISLLAQVLAVREKYKMLRRLEDEYYKED